MKSLASSIAFSVISALIFGIIVPQLLFSFIAAIIGAASFKDAAVPYLFAFHLALTFIIAPLVAAVVTYKLARRPSLLLAFSDDAQDLYSPRTRRSAIFSSALTLLLTFILGNICLSTWLLLLPWSFAGW